MIRTLNIGDRFAKPVIYRLQLLDNVVSGIWIMTQQLIKALDICECFDQLLLFVFA